MNPTHRKTYPMSARFAALALAIATNALAAEPAAETPETASAAAPPVSASSDCSRGFGSRLVGAYEEDFNPAPADPNAAPPARRAMPSPFSSPPFPSAEWQLGGVAYPIGVPNLNSRYPLERALECTGFGKWMTDNRVEIYGWINPSANLSTSNFSNYPLSYSVRPNRVEFNQFVLRIERVPDTVQTDHIDWGFHFDNLYGYDYHFTTARGVFSNQLLNNPNPNQPLNGKIYGYDPFLFYADLYIPSIAQGMVVRVGRWLSLPDIEAQFSPNNYLVSHSILYTVDPFSQMGILTTTKLNDQWTVQLGINGSNDVAVWNSAARASLQACVRWVSASNNDMLYPCVNNWNKKDYNYNNVQMYVMTWGHRFSEDVHILTEAYRMYGRNIPGFGAPDANNDPTAGSAGEYGIVNYINVALNPTNMISFRNEWYNDKDGQRTGFATRYTSHTLGLTHWMSQNISVRPEIRYEHSYDVPAYDAGKKSSQTIALVDLIFHF